MPNAKETVHAGYLPVKFGPPKKYGERKVHMYYVIYRDVNGHWRWRLNAANHEAIASGEGYVNKSDCQNAVRLVKTSSLAPVHER